MNQKPPMRLLQDPQDPTLAAELSEFHQQSQMAPFDVQAGLARFEGALAALPQTAAAAGSAAAGTGVKTASALAGLKGVLLATTAVVGIGTAGWALWPSSDAQPSGASEPAAQLQAPAAPFAIQKSPSPESPSNPANAAATGQATSKGANSLQAELRLVKDVRQALNRGQARSALEMLKRGQVRFRRGALVQERQALMVLALHKSGQKTKATKQAKAFLAKHPDSPMSARIRRLLRSSKR